MNFISDMDLLSPSDNTSFAVIAMCFNIEILEILAQTKYDAKGFCVTNKEPSFMEIDISGKWIMDTEVEPIYASGMIMDAIDEMLKGAPVHDVVYVQGGMPG